MPIKAPRLPYDRLREIAESFLADYHPQRSMPVPIEEIIELQFKIDIVPVPGIRGVLEIDAWISNDLTTIYVDEFVYYKRPNRYRFSLAHELSHCLIHTNIFERLQFKTIAEWRSAIDSIPADQYSWIEWQAYCLAGLVLVPTSELQVAYERADRSAWDAGVSLKDSDEEIQKPVFANIGEKFGVSWEVIRKRLQKEGLLGNRQR